jgi:hypothetical protein
MPISTVESILVRIHKNRLRVNKEMVVDSPLDLKGQV